MQEQGLTVHELLGIARRRAPRIALVAIVVLGVGLPAALYWPAVYRSTATILIEEQEIPREFVRSTVTSYADERIQVIGQQVMTRSTLTQIMEKYDLYPRERRFVSNEELLERMRRDIKVQTVSADVSDRRAALRGSATIAFRLSFDSESPAKAQQVANELVSHYLNENLRTRRRRATETSEFLAEEALRLGKQIAQIEAGLAAFKRANAGRLPELAPLNAQLRDRAETELIELDRQVRMLEDRRVYLETQLTVVKETAPLPSERVLEPGERLRALRNQYAGQSGVYAEPHPDLARMRREIDALEKSTGAARPAAVDAKALEEARNELGSLEERYAPDHPDVVQQRKRVAALEERGAAEPKKPDNPAYVTLAAQIESTRREADSLRERRVELEARLASLDGRLLQMPGVEQAYRELLRDHENALVKYKDIRAKEMEARVSLELEKERKGERFSLIDPPQFPERPHEPNRRKLLALAFLGAVGGGLGAAGLAESMDGSVRSARALGALLESPLLGVVPRARNDAERTRRRRLVLAAIAVFALLLVCAAAAVHFLVMPLDSLWYVLLRRLQI